MLIKHVKAITYIISIDYQAFQATGLDESDVGIFETLIKRSFNTSKVDGPFVDGTLRVTIMVPPPTSAGSQLSVSRARSVILERINYLVRRNTPKVSLGKTTVVHGG